MGKIIALDFGLKHIGLAISDAGKTFAFAREKITNNSNVFAQLSELINKEQIDELIISKSSSAEVKAASDDFVESLKKHITIPIHFLDEKFTTKLAMEIPKTLGMKKKQRQTFDDHSAAAAYLLESYLQGQKS